MRRSERAEGKDVLSPREKGKRGGKGRGEMKESQGKLREKDRLGRNRLRPD